MKYSDRVKRFSATNWWAREANNLLNNLPKGHYIDVGCGTGRLSSLAMRQGIFITGVEPLAELRRLAAESEQIMTYERVADLTQREAYAGAIFSHSFNQVEDIEKTFEHLDKVMKRPSVVAISAPDPRYQQVMWLVNKIRGYKADSTIYRDFKAKDYVEFLEARGYTIALVERNNFMGGLIPNRLLVIGVKL